MMMIGENNYYYEHQVSTQNEGGGGDGLTLKKGPWTAAEDVVLEEYVKTRGEGNWNAVQKNTGLARCGKSCRLRWANHLRPNLKKGAFSAEEERIIVESHALMGNKWARMATRLPGRTDNEIKNYWNTRVKRRQRQGLPLYPPEIESLYLNTSPSTPPLSRPSPSVHVSPRHNPHFSNAYFPTTSPHKRFRYDLGHEKNNDGSSFMLPFSSFNHNLFNPQHYSNSFSLESSRILQSHFNPGQFVSTTRFHYPFKNELPSNQSFTLNGNNSEVTLDYRRNNNDHSSNDDYNSNRHCSSLNFSGNGLLEDMLREAQALTDNNETMASRSCLVGSTSSSEGLNSGLNAKEETKEQIMKTTKHEPMSVHEWFIGNGEASIGTNDNLGLDFQLHD